MHPIFEYGTEEMRRRFLPELAIGNFIGCFFGLTEPNHGSDSSSMETRSRFDVDTNQFILIGCKNWITNSLIANVNIIWAKNKKGKIRGYLVERGTPELEAPAISLGLRLQQIS